MTVADLVYIDTTGYHWADYPTFLAWLQDQYRAIYGADVYLEADSQDGQFVAILARALYDTAALGGSVYNSFSPVSAQGTGLSRNVKINGINRRPATKSTVDLTIVGQTGTTILNGVATDNLNQKWDLPASVTIPGGGTTSVTATAQDAGALNALPNTITTIFTPTLGWQTVNNPSAAAPGVAVETNAELRIRQAQSVANPSLTVLEGTLGAVENVTGVTKAEAYENDTGSTDALGLPAHSIAIVALGGDETEIAQAIQVHKTPGTQTDGTTTVIVYDTHGMPLNIHFYRPTNVTITVDITLTAGPAYTSDYTDQIKQALATYINSLRIGQTVLITKFYYPAYLQNSFAGQSYDIVTLEIGKDLDPVSDINIELDFDENPVCDPDTDITIVVT